MMRTVNSVKNPRWSDPTGYRIDMEVDFDELDEIYVPFTAYKNDLEPHSVDLFNRAIAGEFGEVSDYVPPSDITGSDAVSRMREQRNEKLAESDYVENPTYWATLSDEDKSAWTTYRNALRDITNSVTDPVYTCIVALDQDNPEYYTTTYTPNFEWPVAPT